MAAGLVIRAGSEIATTCGPTDGGHMAMTAATRIKSREREDLAQELRRQITGEVRFDPYSRLLYSTDASIYQMDPIGVVIPRTAADVQAVVEVARDNNVPVLPRAGGTSLAGQTVNHAIVVDFSKYLNQVLEVNHDEGWACLLYTSPSPRD